MRSSQRFFDTAHDDIAAKQHQHAVDRRRMRGARHQQTNRHGELRHLQLVCAKRCLQRCGDRLLGPLHRLERCSQLGQCRTHGIRDVLRERLGVPIEGPHEADRYLLDSLPETGALVGRVYPGSPADRAGLKGSTVTTGSGGAPTERNEAGALAELKRYLDTGIDAFFADDPGLARRALSGKTPR